jgi:hypothetical protein
MPNVERVLPRHTKRRAKYANRSLWLSVGWVTLCVSLCQIRQKFGHPEDNVAHQSAIGARPYLLCNAAWDVIASLSEDDPNSEARVASITRLDHGTNAISQRQQPKTPVVPVGRMLRLLGIDAADLDNATVSVKASGLRELLTEIARQQPFDPEFYADCYPDVEAARMAGMVSDLREHFVNSGFLEGRLPCEPPFDPVWYANYYPDLATAIPASDAKALRNHFITTGLVEGRAGTAASLAASGRSGE